MKKHKKVKPVLISLAILVTILMIWIVWENNSPVATEYELKSQKISESFDGYTIAHISDLHNDSLGKDNKRVIDLIVDAQPDIIAITGDMIDSYHTDADIAIDFINKVQKIAPCYYVTGNHEARLPNEYNELKTAMIDCGVTILENTTHTITIDGGSISLVGIDDPSFKSPYVVHGPEIIDEQLKNLNLTNEYYSILLSHRPEVFDIYVKYKVNLVLSGHAHGGQFRLPFVGGIFAPNQGFFPKYDAGIHTEGDCSMIVNRGIGNSVFPFRLNNRPEVVIIELKSDV